jgi:hypothetical protein
MGGDLVVSLGSGGAVPSSFSDVRLVGVVLSAWSRHRSSALGDHSIQLLCHIVLPWL